MAGQTWLDEIRLAARRNTLRRLEDAKLDKEAAEVVVTDEPVAEVKKAKK